MYTECFDSKIFIFGLLSFIGRDHMKKFIIKSKKGLKSSTVKVRRVTEVRQVSKVQKVSKARQV